MLSGSTFPRCAFCILAVLPVMAAEPQLVVDRGLPQANLNNSSGSARSNVRWAVPADGFLGDDFTIGAPGERKYRFISEKPCFGKAFDSWMGRSSPGRDDRFAEAQRLSSNRDRIRSAELSLTQKYIDTQFPEATGRVMMADASSNPTHAFHHFGELDSNAPLSGHAVP